jgi:hypothetical protein
MSEDRQDPAGGDFTLLDCFTNNFCLSLLDSRAPFCIMDAMRVVEAALSERCSLFFGSSVELSAQLRL